MFFQGNHMILIPQLNVCQYQCLSISQVLGFDQGAVLMQIGSFPSIPLCIKNMCENQIYLGDQYMDLKGSDYSNNNKIIRMIMRGKDEKTITPAFMQVAMTLFTLHQPLPQPIIELLIKKRKQKLTERQNKQIYELIKYNAVFPLISNPKTLVELSSGLNLCEVRAGRTLKDDEDCQILLDGTVKLYQIIPTDPKKEQQGQFPNGNIHESDIRLSVIRVSSRKQIKVQKEKVALGSIIDYHRCLKNPYVYEALSHCRFLYIDKKIYEPIVVSFYLAKVKQLQEFFIKIPLFDKLYRNSLQQLINSFEQVSCNFNKKIFTQGDPITHIYIVKSGQFILQKSISSQTQMKMGKLLIKKTTQQQKKQRIRAIHDHYRICPYKIIHQKTILGAAQVFYNQNRHLSTMKCHQEGSILFKVDVQTFFNKLIMPQNPQEYVMDCLLRNFEKAVKQISKGVKINESNPLILRSLPNATASRIKTCPGNQILSDINVPIPKQIQKRRNRDSESYYQSKKHQHHRYHSSSDIESSKKTIKSESNGSFFEKINKTIMSKTQRGRSFRKRKQPKQFKSQVWDNSWGQEKATLKQKKTPAVVQEVVHIVSLKEAYHKLRNLGKCKKDIFQFNIDNVPVFIKKKYAHLCKNRQSK